jgi:protocatechuate 3,4-dioxygenase beta subunit
MCINSSRTGANVLIVRGRVLDAGCQRGLPAMLDVWQANSGGTYSTRGGNYECRSKVRTDPQGYYQFTTVVPAPYRAGNGFRPAHIHYKVSPVDTSYRTLTTQMYFQNDPFLGSGDACRRECSSDNPTKIVGVIRNPDRSWVATWNIIFRR